jgi:hypothetical protein
MFGNKSDQSEVTIKAQTFEVSAKRGISVLEKKIRKWLAANPDIEIISTDFAGFGENIGYVILFRGDEQIREEETFEEPQYEQPIEQPVAQRLDVRFDNVPGMRTANAQTQFNQPPTERQPFRLGPGKTEVNRPQKSLKQESVNRPKIIKAPPVQPPQNVEAIPMAAPPQSMHPERQPQVAVDQMISSPPKPRRSGFTTGAVFGNFDAFKDED